VLSKVSKFISRKNNFTHVKPNSKLCFSNSTTSQFIKISEKFTNSDSLLLTLLSQFGKNVLNIIRNIFFDIDTCDSWSVFWIVVETVVISSSNAEKLIWTVDIIAKVEVIYLINVTFVHICLQKCVEDIFAG